jgi:hypothetical protein
VENFWLRLNFTFNVISLWINSDYNFSSLPQKKVVFRLTWVEALWGGGDVPIETLDDLLGISLNGVNDFMDISWPSLAKISSISRSGDGPHPIETDTLTILSLLAGDGSRS